MGLIKKVVFLLAMSIVSVACSENSDFAGRWCWDGDSDVSAFGILIKKDTSVYRGGYYSVVQSGNLIDDNESAFSFKETNKNIIKTKLKAGISGNTGLIQLQRLANKKMHWLILEMPKGDIFVPKTAILHRC